MCACIYLGVERHLDLSLGDTKFIMCGFVSHADF